MKDFADQLEEFQLERTPGVNVVAQIRSRFQEIHHIEARILIVASSLLCFPTLTEQILKTQVICGTRLGHVLAANQSFVALTSVLINARVSHNASWTAVDLNKFGTTAPQDIDLYFVQEISAFLHVWCLIVAAF